MDFFYSRFIKGLALDSLKASQLSSLKKTVTPLAKAYHPCVILSFYMPKVGSTYLFSILKKLCHLPEYSLSWGYYQNEQNIDVDEVMKILDRDYLSKLMAQATLSNIDIIELFALKPLVITRSIADILVSLRDHFVYDTMHGQPEYTWPQLHVDHSFLDYSSEKQLDLLIDHFTPWFVNFLVSWKMASKRLEHVLWITYDDISLRLPDTVSRILDYYGIQSDLTNLDALVLSEKKAENRFNQGVSGRGLALLSASQMDRLRSFFRYYPELESFI